MQKFDTPTPITTVLDIPAGRIRFIAADRADTTVEILPATASKSRDVKAAEHTAVEYLDGILHIKSTPAKTPLLGASGSIEVTVQLPTGSHIEAKAAAAELRGVGRLGDVTFESAQGPVKLDETTSAHLTLLAGDISIGHLGGPATISTQQGDIHITQAASGTLQLRTNSGDITIGAARAVSASLNAGTDHGRISNTLKNTDGATAGLNIHATTTHGNITAHSL